MINYKNNAYLKKPLINDHTKQLFSFDIHTSGSKKYMFDTYKNIYSIIKREQSNIYEDMTYSPGIKLFVDYDCKLLTYKTRLDRDEQADKIITVILDNINKNIASVFNIHDTPAIILISDTLNKLSIHIIFPDIVFKDIYEMRNFMNNIRIIDHSVYKKGCFRMIYCSKLGIDNIS